MTNFKDVTQRIHLLIDNTTTYMCQWVVTVNG